MIIDRGGPDQFPRRRLFRPTTRETALRLIRSSPPLLILATPTPLSRIGNPHPFSPISSPESSRCTSHQADTSALAPPQEPSKLIPPRAAWHMLLHQPSLLPFLRPLTPSLPQASSRSSPPHSTSSIKAGMTQMPPLGSSSGPVPVPSVRSTVAARAPPTRRPRQSPLARLREASLTDRMGSRLTGALPSLPSSSCPLIARRRRLLACDARPVLRRRPAHLCARRSALCASAHPLSRRDLAPGRLAAVVGRLAPVVVPVGNERHDRGRGGPFSACFRFRERRKGTRPGSGRGG